jgi:hypothetical protein
MVEEPLEDSKKVSAFSTPTFFLPAPPPLMNEDELYWLNPDDFLEKSHHYAYDVTMCESKLVYF